MITVMVVVVLSDALPSIKTNKADPQHLVDVMSEDSSHNRGRDRVKVDTGQDLGREGIMATIKGRTSSHQEWSHKAKTRIKGKIRVRDRVHVSSLSMDSRDKVRDRDRDIQIRIKVRVSIKDRTIISSRVMTTTSSNNSSSHLTCVSNNNSHNHHVMALRVLK